MTLAGASPSTPLEALGVPPGLPVVPPLPRQPDVPVEDVMEEWKVWMRTLSKDSQDVMEETVIEAAAALQSASLLRIKDAVGLESTDVHDFPTWSGLSMKARALVKRGIFAANNVYNKTNKEAGIQRAATPLRRRSNGSSMLELAGRGASDAAVTRALAVLEDATWSVSELLQKH